MDRKFSFFLLVCALILVIGCPDQCDCTDISTGIYVSCNCKMQNFTGNVDLPHNTSTLHLDNCYLPSDFALANQHLQRIGLDFSNLESIPNGSFTDLPNLKEIKVVSHLLPLSELPNIFTSLRPNQTI